MADGAALRFGTAVESVIEPFNPLVIIVRSYKQLPTHVTKGLRDAGAEQVLLNLKDRLKMVLDGSAPIETVSGLQREAFLQADNITTQATRKPPRPTTGQVEHLELPQQLIRAVE